MNRLFFFFDGAWLCMRQSQQEVAVITARCDKIWRGCWRVRTMKHTEDGGKANGNTNKKQIEKS